MTPVHKGELTRAVQFGRDVKDLLALCKNREDVDDFYNGHRTAFMAAAWSSPEMLDPIWNKYKEVCSIEILKDVLLKPVNYYGCSSWNVFMSACTCPWDGNPDLIWQVYGYYKEVFGDRQAREVIEARMDWSALRRFGPARAAGIKEFVDKEIFGKEDLAVLPEARRSRRNASARRPSDKTAVAHAAAPQGGSAASAAISDEDNGDDRPRKKMKMRRTPTRGAAAKATEGDSDGASAAGSDDDAKPRATRKKSPNTLSQGSHGDVDGEEDTKPRASRKKSPGSGSRPGGDEASSKNGEARPKQRPSQTTKGALKQNGTATVKLESREIISVDSDEGEAQPDDAPSADSEAQPDRAGSLNSEAPRAQANVAESTNPEAPPEPGAKAMLLAIEQELGIPNDASTLPARVTRIEAIYGHAPNGDIRSKIKWLYKDIFGRADAGNSG